MTRWVENTVTGNTWVDVNKLEVIQITQEPDTLNWVVEGVTAAQRQTVLLLGPYETEEEARRMTLALLGGEDQPDVTRLKRELRQRNESIQHDGSTRSPDRPTR